MMVTMMVIFKLMKIKQCHQSDSQVRMREVQGAICIASIVQLVIGYTGVCITILVIQGQMIS